jgi:hypothetical protein
MVISPSVVLITATSFVALTRFPFVRLNERDETLEVNAGLLEVALANRWRARAGFA